MKSENKIMRVLAKQVEDDIGRQIDKSEMVTVFTRCPKCRSRNEDGACTLFGDVFKCNNCGNQFDKEGGSV